MAVCAHCRSTLVRRDLDLDRLGEMAVLAEDRSPFALRWRGAYRKVGFELIGRLQLRYAEGYWNEWYARFDDGRLGWLSEGSGLCYLTFERTLKTQLPAQEAFQIGMQARLDGVAYTVSNIETAHCVAAEGELPFHVEPGYAAPSVDLRAEQGFASLDYSDTPPKVYIGEALSLDELLAPGTANAPAQPKRVAARAFKCTSCGAPLTARSGEIHAVGCQHCGAVIDPDSAELKILSRAKRALEIPLLGIGSSGRLRGHDYVVLGCLLRSCVVDGLSYFWDEYLLHSEQRGYAWLVCNDGHWSLGQPCKTAPQNLRGGKPTLNKRQYAHFSQYPAVVEQVFGEFNWQVKAGDKVKVDDYIAPPFMLSRERDKKEETWTEAEYLQPDEVAQAFKPTQPLPHPTGVGANQPSPYRDGKRYLMALLVFGLLTVLLQIVFSSSADEARLWQQQLTLDADQQRLSFTSAPFRLDGQHNLAIRQHSNLDNRWVYADLALINRQSGEAIRLGRELSYYSGYDSDGHWSEGSNDDEALLNRVPAGEYLLEVELETEQQGKVLQHQIELVRDVPIWSSFWLLLLWLLAIPAWAWHRAQVFETRRWANSDHPKGDD
ncbi:protein of unknown function [Chitinimonas taiwanensis DSM 18899]|uniref:DUF4178 domain-containing protein n=2 Tax=Chitinimonas TaxID=240411 RepID=A0A1K2H5B4_9NEIS|nr:protein of unknown function [Chitinimonas taiwanensis DSM 18899]